jgi:hypothetical protein
MCWYESFDTFPGKGEETEAPLNDLIEIGLFTAEPGGGAFDKKDVIHMERQKVRGGMQVFRFVTDKKPTHAGIDPYNFYIDRNSADNVGSVDLLPLSGTTGS